MDNDSRKAKRTVLPGSGLQGLSEIKRLERNRVKEINHPKTTIIHSLREPLQISPHLGTTPKDNTKRQRTSPEQEQLTSISR
jgi:hypothetical protein